MFKNDMKILDLEEKGAIQFGFSHITQNELYLIVSRMINEKSIFECREFFIGLQKIFTRAIIIETANKLEKLSTDKGDQFFIETAVSLNADYLVTNDGENGLLELGQYKDVKIVKPEKLVKSLNKVRM